MIIFWLTMIYKTNSGSYELNTILVDLNGTLTVWWIMDKQTPELLNELKSLWYRIILLTGDQRGNGTSFEDLWLEVIIVKNADEKKQFALTCDIDKMVAIGNARIDIGMFEVAKISIATMQWEWIHVGILPYVDIIVPSFADACRLLIDEDIFAATMKN